MSFSNFPTEILSKVFRYLKQIDLQNCSAVCKRWDDVTEVIYKDLCKKEYPDTYEEAYRKANLSWQELYKSFSLWPRIQFAEMNLYHTHELDKGMLLFMHERDRQFFVLKNGIISYPQNTPADEGMHTLGRNCVLYYDSNDLQDFEERRFDENPFDQYAENDDFIVFTGKGNELYIMPKANDKLIHIGKVKHYEYGDVSRFELVKNKVYFMDEQNTIWVSQLEEQDGEIVAKTEPLDKLIVDCYINITAMSYVNDNHTNILTCRGHIYSIIDKKITHAAHLVKQCDRFTAVDTLQRHGFDWSTQAVYDWLHQRDIIEMDQVVLSKLKEVTVCKHGKVVVLGTSRRVIHIYYNPYRRDGALKLYNAKPDLKIDLNEWYPLDSHQRFRKIEQIDVIEIVNGHRIVVLYGNKILIIELIHGASLNKRTAENSSGSILKKNRIN